MKRIVLTSLLFCLPFLAMAEIVVGDVSGQVEMMKPGSASWEAVTTGESLPRNTTISTGFNSRVQLKVNEASEVDLKPMTRLKIEEAVAQAGGDQNTRLFMGTGRIRASVKRNEGSSHMFQVRTPVATAAVRGTGFTLSPANLDVTEGTVRFSIGSYTFSVPRNQKSRVTMINGQPGLLSPVEQALIDRKVDTQAGFGANAGSGSTGAGSKTGYAAITLY